MAATAEAKQERVEARGDQAALFDRGILEAEQKYGIKLSTRLDRNVQVTNGETNQHIGEAWYYDGPTKISVTASNLNFERMLGELGGNITLMLKDHAVARKAA